MKSLQKQLIAKRNAQFKGLAERVVASDGRLGRFEEEIIQMDRYGRLIAASPSKRDPLNLLIIGFGLATIVVGLAWILPVSNTSVVADAHAESISLQLAKNWEWRGTQRVQDGFRIENFSDIEIPRRDVSTKPPNDLTGQPWMDLQGGWIALSRLDFQRGTRLRIERGADGFIYIHTFGAAVGGEVTVQGAVQVAAGVEWNSEDEELDYSIKRSIPESLKFSADGSELIPTMLRVKPTEELEFESIIVDEISFSRPQSYGTGYLEPVCTVVEGSVKLTDIQHTSNLSESDCLTMRGERGRIVKMSIGERIELRFQGEAKEVAIGPIGFQREITPSLLEWIYHNERTYVLVAALTLLWGVPLGMRM